MEKTKTNKLVISGMMVALGTILSLLKLYELPFGGTVTIASMVPMVLVGYMYGVRWGMFTSLIYSLLQLICGISTGIISKMFLPGDEQMAFGAAITICLFDYILAYLVLGVAGMFKGKLKRAGTEIVLGSIVALVLRWLMHTISGYIFYGAWAGWFFGDSTGLAGIKAFEGFCTWVMENVQGNALSLLYSVIYNGAYMVPEIIITAIITPVIYAVMKRNKNI